MEDNKLVKVWEVWGTQMNLDDYTTLLKKVCHFDNPEAAEAFLGQPITFKSNGDACLPNGFVLDSAPYENRYCEIRIKWVPKNGYWID